MNGEKTQNYNTIIDNTGRLTVGEGELRKGWKDSFEDPYNVTLDEQVLVSMYGWDVYGSYNYIERPNKQDYNDSKIASKDEVTREMIKSGPSNGHE